MNRKQRDELKKRIALVINAFAGLFILGGVAFYLIVHIARFYR